MLNQKFGLFLNLYQTRKILVMVRKQFEILAILIFRSTRSTSKQKILILKESFLPIFNNNHLGKKRNHFHGGRSSMSHSIKVSRMTSLHKVIIKSVFSDESNWICLIYFGCWNKEKYRKSFTEVLYLGLNVALYDIP